MGKKDLYVYSRLNRAKISLSNVNLQIKVFNCTKRSGPHPQNLFQYIPLLLFHTKQASCTQLLPVSCVVMKSFGFEKWLVLKIDSL